MCNREAEFDAPREECASDGEGSEPNDGVPVENVTARDLVIDRVDTTSQLGQNGQPEVAVLQLECPIGRFSRFGCDLILQGVGIDVSDTVLRVKDGVPVFAQEPVRRKSQFPAAALDFRCGIMAGRHH